MSELLWANRTLSKIAHRVVDLQHGLAFAPACHEVGACPLERLPAKLTGIEVVIVTTGRPVPTNGTRADLYPATQADFRADILPRLKGFSGIVLVVSNPVDLLARSVHVEGHIPSHRVFGLGTLVETARLRASLGSYLSPRRPAREVWAYVIGSHDEHCVVVPTSTGMGATLEPELLEVARGEAVEGARRVKKDTRSTLHPIAEAVCAVVEAFASNRRSILTLSVRDPENGLFYSLPCTVGLSLESLAQSIGSHPDETVRG